MTIVIINGKYFERVQLPAKAKFGEGIILPDRYFNIPLPIVPKHELGLSFPPRNLPIKFGKIRPQSF